MTKEVGLRIFRKNSSFEKGVFVVREDGGASFECEDIPSVIYRVRVIRAAHSAGWVVVNIDCAPLHDMEWKPDQPLCHCLPLTVMQQQALWKGLNE